MDLNIFKTITTLDKKYMKVYLDGLEECQSFRYKCDDSIQTVSSLLSKAESRQLGLVLLSKLLDQCTVETLEHKANLWTTLLLKACNTHELNKNSVLIFDNLSKLAKLSQLSHDLSKTFSTNLTKVYESLSLTPNVGYLASLSCIEIFLRLYPGPSGSSKTGIERFLMQFIDNNDENISQKCGKCLLQLQQVRGGGVQGINHKAQWKDYQLRLLGSIHDTFKKSFAKCNEIYDDAVVNEQLNVPALKLSDEPVLRAAQLNIRFCNFVDYLKIAISDPFPVAKPIQPKKILNLISRGLGVTCEILQKNPISDNLAISVLIPNMHIKLMELLEALILTLGSHLREHCQFILNLLMDTLKWTSTPSKGSKKNFLKLRSSAYKVLEVWCMTLRGGSLCEKYAEILVREIFNDTQPFQNDFTLKVLSGARKNMSKKVRRQFHKATNDQSNISQMHSSDKLIRKENFSDEGNQSACIAALRCLQQVLLVAGSFIKPTMTKVVQNNVLQICALFYEFPIHKQHLYYNYQCRLEIYNVLYIFIMTPHHMCPPPTQMAMNIFLTAQMLDRSSKVQHRCTVILNSLEKLVHPIKEGLLFPIEMRDIRNAFIKHGQQRLLNELDTNLESDNELCNGEPEVVVDESNVGNSINSRKIEEDNHNRNDSNDVSDEIDEINEIDECISKTSESNEHIDDNSAESIVCNNEEKSGNQADDDILREPSAKIMKFENNSAIVVPASQPMNINELSNDENILIADIEATFIDELN